MTLDDLCRELNNYFDMDRYFGEFVIEDGIIDLTGTGILPNQYFRIAGSVFNDGVYKYEPEVDPTEENPETHRPVLEDETFDGAVWLMSIPKGVLSLMEEINAWEEKYGGADSQAASPFQSESFGGYSYSKSGGSSSGDADTGDAGSWQKAFHNRLNKYRKIRSV